MRTEYTLYKNISAGLIPAYFPRRNRNSTISKNNDHKLHAKGFTMKKIKRTDDQFITQRKYKRNIKNSAE